jgi:putative PIN family toxin of toxin-antitoxin system
VIRYAVIDTNVLISALLSKHDDSATVLVVDKIFSGEVIPVLSEPILREYQDVLRRKKFRFSDEQTDVLLQVICKYGEVIIPDASDEILPDAKDLPFYEVVISTQDIGTHLVTGNMKHFPKEPFIVTPSQFLEILQQ